MRSYEIQIFKGGKWEFDSHFDDRDSAMSDADQLAADLRIQGGGSLKRIMIKIQMLPPVTSSLPECAKRMDLATIDKALKRYPTTSLSQPERTVFVRAQSIGKGRQRRVEARFWH